MADIGGIAETYVGEAESTDVGRDILWTHTVVQRLVVIWPISIIYYNGIRINPSDEPRHTWQSLCFLSTPTIAHTQRTKANSTSPGKREDNHFFHAKYYT